MTGGAGRVGDRFGAYEVVRYLATGGMADLHLARRAEDDAEVVLKTLQDRYAGDAAVAAMFRDELAIAARLSHANIARVVDVGREGDRDFIAMEYVRGADLVAIARRASERGEWIPRAVGAGIVLQVARALSHAHSADDALGPLEIVHCDVSPGNVVVSLSGTAKLVDFGVARSRIAERGEAQVAGKYNYMAPEQIRGEAVDARADLFPLGVILFEFTVGKRLFRGSAAEVMRKVLEAPIPLPTEIAPGFPAGLEAVIMRLLARDREARFSTAAEAADALEAWLAGQPDGWREPDVGAFVRGLFAEEPVEATVEAPADADEAGAGVAGDANDAATDLQPAPAPTAPPMRWSHALLLAALALLVGALAALATIFTG